MSAPHKDDIEDAEWNISDFEAQVARHNTRAADFQAIADDMTQPVARREKFAVYAMQERTCADAAKENARREQLRLDELVRDLRSDEEERSAKGVRTTFYREAA